MKDIVSNCNFQVSAFFQKASEVEPVTFILYWSLHNSVVSRSENKMRRLFINIYILIILYFYDTRFFSCYGFCCTHFQVHFFHCLLCLQGMRKYTQRVFKQPSPKIARGGEATPYRINIRPDNVYKFITYWRHLDRKRSTTFMNKVQFPLLPRNKTK